jgi:uncharacterized membrane protein YphA (DoxX/SURF4 family)
MFSPLSTIDTGRRRPGGGALNGLRTIAVLRIGSGLVLFLAYALQATVEAWHFIWHSGRFALVGTLGQAGLPWANVLAPTVAFIAVTVSVAWVVGFFTRLFAALFLPIAFVALFVAARVGASESASVVAWLFVFISITLMLYGSGQISVDGLFRLGGRSKQRKLF